MVIVKLSAGLGNQMFQYALGRRLSLDWREELKFDLSWFSNIQKCETPRDLEISKFNINLTQITPKDISKSKCELIKENIRKIIAKVRGRIDRSYYYSFHPSLLKKRRYTYLDGYFQSYKYFDSIRKTLLADFVLKNGYSTEASVFKKQIEQAKQPVSIHIRRGDYITTCKNWNGVCGLDYYKKAVAEIRKKFNDIELYIFSDDIDWAKSNLEFNYPMTFVSGSSLNCVEELMLMSLCKHQIIANSTFSWWAAWLNQNDQKIVIAPSKWLVAADINTNDLLPDSWLRI